MHKVHGTMIRIVNKDSLAQFQDKIEMKVGKIYINQLK
jgi:hypothetical protein